MGRDTCVWCSLISFFTTGFIYVCSNRKSPLCVINRAETNIPNIRFNEYSIETNICILLIDNYMIFVYIGGIENIYSYQNCLLLANLCIIHFVAIIILL